MSGAPEIRLLCFVKDSINTQPIAIYAQPDADGFDVKLLINKIAAFPVGNSTIWKVSAPRD